jgi:ATP-dependent exoDNAse (exonuclease V) beta subunit
VDFKTDDVRADDLAGKIKTYTPQLKLYAAALEKIFTRRVTLRALHFLAARRTENI